MTNPTCRDCPSFVTADDSANVYSKSLGADSCVRHGYLLSQPKASASVNDRTVKNFAAGCPNHGEPRPIPAPVVFTAQVSIGDPGSAKPNANTSQPPSCYNCVNFVAPDITERELGWPMAACAAKGRLLFPQRYIAEADDCLQGVYGPRRTTTDGMVMLPQYGAIIKAGQKPAVPYEFTAESARHSIDPRDYVTDKPVTPEEQAGFIRAWREVRDPESLRPSVYMPIFDGTRLVEHFCPAKDHTDCNHDPRSTYGGHRPDLYIDHQAMLYDFVVEMICLDETPVLIGGAGTGKTESLAWVAYLMDLPFTRFSITKATEEWMLKGETKLVVDPATGQQVTQWVDGRLTARMRQPGVIGMDELNLNNALYEFMRPMLDNAKQLVLDENQGAYVIRGDYTFLAVTQNPADDPIYVGTEPMSAADSSRVSPFRFALPDNDVERAIIRRHCEDGGYDIDEVVLDKIMQIATDIRKMIADGLPIAWGIRDQVKVARKTEYYSLMKAYRRAVLDGLDSELVTPILKIVQGVA